MDKIVLIDGNSIMNRAFYGIMGNKMLMTNDGRYTNAVYGFLSILFKILEDLNPQYLVVTFDLKGPTKRHKLYDGYKANRHGMPNELAEQMPLIKEILEAMNIDIVEKEGYEGDDILGTLSRYAEKQGLDVTILSGDRDTFQLATNKVTIRIPRTKGGKTEVENFDRNKVIETYGIEPKQLIEVKGLQGDSSDNIPGVPGIGEKTALSLVQKYGSIENLYKKVENNEDDLKGKQREKIIDNKELALMSKELGTIDINVPIEDTLENFKVEEWDKDKVLEIFKELKFNRYIERFNLQNENIETKKELKDLFEIKEIQTIKDIEKDIIKNKKIVYYLGTEKDENPEKIIKEKITSISVYSEKTSEIYYLEITNINDLKTIFESEEIKKYGYKIKQDYILLKQENITMKGIEYDAEIAGYLLNPTTNKYPIEALSLEYTKIDIQEYLQNLGIEENEQKQINLFDEAPKQTDNINKYKESIYAYCINEIYKSTMIELEKINAVELFKEIEMPTAEVLADMQWNGMHVIEEELNNFGTELKYNLDRLTIEIYELAEEEFNINSTKQLGVILFEKLKLPVYKKTKNGYSTDVDVLEKLVDDHPIIQKILDYRQLMKLNSTYVEGLKQYINPKTKRIHSFFHQTITATGRISSTEPNLQNIPTRIELGKQLRKVFKPEGNKVYLDADYSQIELRVLAHISKDANMIDAFNNNEDIHKQAASKVFNVPLEEVTKTQRSQAKAVNFGIVYGISDFGLGGQLGVSRKKAKEYIEQYLEKYNGIKEFMENITETAKEQGYVETLFNRRRYIPELNSNNYMVRQFGSRAAMNTPIQGTAADIMKIAMINVFKELKQRNLKSKIVLQVHDEMMIEALQDEKEEVKQIIKSSMESAIKLDVPLIADISEATNWYECK